IKPTIRCRWTCTTTSFTSSAASTVQRLKLTRLDRPSSSTGAPFPECSCTPSCPGEASFRPTIPFICPVERGERIRSHLCLAKTPSGQKLNRRIDILTVKSYLDRPARARWKAMKINADGILARDSIVHENAIAEVLKITATMKTIDLADRERETLTATARHEPLIYGGRLFAGDLIGETDLPEWTG